MHGTIAVLLARTGMMHLGVPIRVADATQVPLTQMMQLVEEVNSSVAAGDVRHSMACWFSAAARMV